MRRKFLFLFLEQPSPQLVDLLATGSQDKPVLIKEF
jgi:hypothetical protein